MDKEEIAKFIGNKIKEYRKQNNWTQSVETSHQLKYQKR